jgi:hypothetical protein
MRNTALLIGMVLGLAGRASAQPQVVKSHRASERQSLVMQTNDRVVRSFLVFRVMRSAEQQQDRLQVARERDRYNLNAARAPAVTNESAYGAAMLGASVFLAAHAPGPLRAMFDGERVVHAGPAVFEGGGMGAGLGGRF